MEEPRAHIELPEPPGRMRQLPRDARGYVYPWFVDTLPSTGQLDHRTMNRGKLVQAIERGLCWVCGGPMGTRRRTFLIGPMCLVNRVTAEPGCHYECAEYSARYCPFLSRPKQKRRQFRDEELGGLEKSSAGMPICRNPGVALLYSTLDWHPERIRADRSRGIGSGILFRLGDPERLNAFAEGRPATVEELNASIESGLPILMEAARADGPSAVLELHAAKRLADQAISTRMMAEVSP